MATLLIRMTSAPYGSSNASDGLDFALAATNYGHEVIMLFEGKGLFQLYPQAQQSGVKNHAKRLKSVPLFDIEDCYYAASDVNALGAEESRFPAMVSALDDTVIITLIEQADHVVTF